jgi:prophage regulatory protein
MRHRRLNRSHVISSPAAPADDLFGYAQRTPSAPAPTLDDELWNVRVISAKTGLARSTIYAYVKQGLFPRQRQLGPGRVGWRASEVRGWIASR